MAPRDSWADSSRSGSSGPGPIRSAPGTIREPTTPELPPLIVIAGATATGKTALSLELARSIAGAEIISADSRQVYRGMDIGTAKATVAERAVAPHHGLDLVDPDEPFNAADYQRHAIAALRTIGQRGGVAVLVGGTGLYLRAVAHGLPLDGDDVDPRLRLELEDRLRSEGLKALVDELRGLDPEGAHAIDLQNPRRVVRALERATLSGSARPQPGRGYAAPLLWLGLGLDAVAHRIRVDERAAHQFGHGLIDEAAGLRERYREDLPAFSAMGYREAFDVLAGRSSVAEARQRDAQRTWVYARRQRTWFRSEAAIEWLDAGEGLTDRALASVEPWLGQIGRADYAGGDEP